mgnify:CR=1 FL=1
MQIYENQDKNVVNSFSDTSLELNNSNSLDNLEQKSSRQEKKKNKEISYTDELRRKLIHLFSLNISLIYILIDKWTAFWIMLLIAIITVALDVLSKKVDPVQKFFYKYFGSILRKHEKKKNKFRLNGASWLVISATLTILIFPKLFACVALSVLIVSDIASALVGRKWGRIPFFKKKTVEGSTAFFLTSAATVLVYFWVFQLNNYFLLYGLIASLLTTFGEAISKQIKVDDNLIVPIVFAGFLWIVELILNTNNLTMLTALL